MAREYKTDWKYNDVIPAEDINRWEENTKAIDEENGTLIGEREIESGLRYRLKEFKNYYILTVMGTLTNGNVTFYDGINHKQSVTTFVTAATYENGNMVDRLVKISINTEESNNITISNADGSSITIEGIYKDIMVLK